MTGRAGFARMMEDERICQKYIFGARWQMSGLSEIERALVAGNLKHYRELCGLTQKQIAQLVGLKPLAYGKAERGESLPRDGVLERFCEVARIQMGNLLEPLDVPKVSCLRNKFKSAREKAGSVETVRLAIKRARDIRYLLETMSGRTAEADRRRLREVRRSAAANRGGMAEWARRQFSPCDAFSPERFPEFLDGFGLIVCGFPFPGDAVDGFAFEDGEAGPLIAVNTSETVTWEKRVETFSHEFGHVLNGTMDGDHGSKRGGDKAENDAVEFYRDFLLPVELFREQWRSLPAFLTFAQRVYRIRSWNKVPASLVLHRVEETGVRSGKVYMAYHAEMQRRGYTEKPEPAPLTIRMASDPYEALALRAYDEGEISLSKCAEFLWKRPRDILFAKRETAWA